MFTTKVNGTGLGLPTCFTIIRHHGGTFEISNAPEGGACVRITLPVLPNTVPQPLDPVPHTDILQPLSGRVLLLDDQPDVLETIASLLLAMGLELQTCSCGEDAIELHKQAMAAGTPWQAIVMDRHLRDGLDSLSTLARLKQLDPTLRAMIMSGAPEDPVMQDPQQYGFALAINKPFGLLALQRSLQKLLS
jgi:CheY-like chemotaxis protein